MAWKDLAKVAQLFQSLGEISGGAPGNWQRKGGGKGFENNRNGGKAAAAKLWFHWDDCHDAKSKKPTCGPSTACQCCQRPWSKSPPIERMVLWAYKDKLGKTKDSELLKGQKGKGKGAGKGNTKAAAPQQAAPPAQPTDDQLAQLRLERLAALNLNKDTTQQPQQAQLQQQADDSATGGGKQRAAPTPGTLDPDTLLELKQVQATIDSITTLIAADVVVVQPEKQDAEASLASHMLAFQPCATAEARATLEARITETKSLHAAATSADMQQMLSEKLEEQQEKLGRLCKRGAPSAAQEASSLREALQALDRRQKGRLDKEQTGQDKAKERIEKRTDLMTQLYNHISVLADAIQVHENEQLAGHAAKSQTLAQQEEDVAAILRQRIAAADAEVLAGKQKAAAATSQSASATATPPANQEADALSKAMQELEAMRASQQQLMQQIQLLQDRGAAIPAGDATGGAQPPQAKQQPNGQTTGGQPVAMQLSELIPTVLSTDDVFDGACTSMLPKLKVDESEVGKKQLAACGHLHHLLLLWNKGGCLPVSFEELRAHSLAGRETHTLLKLLLGEELWDGWFGLLGANPEDAEPIPRQALSFAALALDELKTLYENGEEAREAAADSFKLLKSAKKRRRDVVANAV